MKQSGLIFDLDKKETYSGTIHIKEGRIEKIVREGDYTSPLIMPGFVDAHIHIESSMLTPREFARMAMPHGTVSTVSDPHEIANVLGLEGVQYMIDNAADCPLKVYFGAPSCVPATTFETAGATLTAADIESLFQREDIVYLSEMMNYPGVLFEDPVVMEKIALAKKYNKRIDGHAPGLTGDDALKYIAAGISTDHECFTYDEAIFKLKAGMKIIIREGSAAKNFDALIPLLDEHPDMIMFCSDDKHPNDLMVSHMDGLVRRAQKQGCDLWNILRAMSLNPVEHYGLDVGLLRVGDSADFILVDDLKNFKVQATFIDGKKVAESGESRIPYQSAALLNKFDTSFKKVDDFTMPYKTTSIRVIEALEGQLITNEVVEDCLVKDGFMVSDTERDILKISVVNRYSDAHPALAFIRNFGLKRGAIASSVAHDSHNIVVVGVDDESIVQAVNGLIHSGGGLSVADGPQVEVLPLGLAGIMSVDPGEKVAEQYIALDAKAKELGTPLAAPFMTLSFMALLVIPKLKLSDLGLFDGGSFSFTETYHS